MPEVGVAGGGGDAGESAGPEAEAHVGGTAGGLAGTAGPAGAFLDLQGNTEWRPNARGFEIRPSGLQGGIPRFPLGMRPEGGDRPTARLHFCGGLILGREPVPLFLAREQFDHELSHTHINHRTPDRPPPPILPREPFAFLGLDRPRMMPGSGRAQLPDRLTAGQ